MPTENIVWSRHSARKYTYTEDDSKIFQNWEKSKNCAPNSNEKLHEDEAKYEGENEG